MNKIIAVTGATGAMGGEVVKSLLASENNFFVKILLYKNDQKKIPRFLSEIIKKHKDRIAMYYGDFSDKYSCQNFVRDADYIFHCAAVIPPHSDHDPVLARKGNYEATKNLIDAVKECGIEKRVRFVNIASVSIYGHRDYRHPWARVGDPLLPSTYDYYAYYKMLAERYVVESGLSYWVSLRQTAILHKYLFANNLKDGLLFHTPWNCPFEWITDRDSGLLCRRLVEKDEAGLLKDFWKKCYNIGGGDGCRNTGYETLNDGFKLMGRSAKSFFEPSWNAARNFHGVWFSDSKDLEELLGFQTESNEVFWKRMGKKYWYFRLAAVLPARLVTTLVFKRLLRDNNAPCYWVENDMIGRVDAFFGGHERYKSIPKKWTDYPLLCEGKTASGKIDFSELKKQEGLTKKGLLLNHGYDEKKGDDLLNLGDMVLAAAFRGGRCLSETMKTGDLYTKLLWECADGHRFFASPYAVLKAGYWCSECDLTLWQYGHRAKSSPFYAQVWYDTHRYGEKDYDIKENEENKLSKKGGRYENNDVCVFGHGKYLEDSTSIQRGNGDRQLKNL